MPPKRQRRGYANKGPALTPKRAATLQRFGGALFEWPASAERQRALTVALGVPRTRIKGWMAGLWKRARAELRRLAATAAERKESVDEKAVASEATADAIAAAGARGRDAVNGQYVLPSCARLFTRGRWKQSLTSAERKELQQGPDKKVDNVSSEGGCRLYRPLPAMDTASR